MGLMKGGMQMGSRRKTVTAEKPPAEMELAEVNEDPISLASDPPSESNDGLKPITSMMTKKEKGKRGTKNNSPSLDTVNEDGDSVRSEEKSVKGATRPTSLNVVGNVGKF